MSGQNHAETKRSTPDQAKNPTQVGFKIKIEKVPDTEAEKLLDKVILSGSASEYNGKMLSPEDFKKNGVLPQYKIEMGGQNIWLSSHPYDIGSGRAAVTGFIERGGSLVPRSFWRSNSQGVWRLLASYATGWYSKEYGEESIMLPAAMQKALSEMTLDDKNIKPIPDAEFVFMGTAANLDTRYNDAVKKGHSFLIDVSSQPVDLPGNFKVKSATPEETKANHGKKLPPGEIGFDDKNNEPDFGKMIDSWQGGSVMYGPITFECYPSKNNNLTYVFCRDKKGRAWIGGIESNAAKMTSHGVKENWIRAEDLTTPAYEYDSQAGGYGNTDDKSGHYIDMYKKYLSKIPMIAEYKKKVDASAQDDAAENMPQPEAKPTAKAEAKEQGPERESLLQAVDKAVGILKKSLDKMGKKADGAERLKWIIAAVKDAKENLESDETDDGKFEVCESKGSENCRREGIPVDDLLEALREIRQQTVDELKQKFDKMKADTGADSADLDAKIEDETKSATKEIDSVIKLIDANASEPTDKWDEWRKRREAYLVHKDHRKTGDDEKNWLLAERALKKRRELILPKKKKGVPGVDEPGEDGKLGKDEQDNISTAVLPENLNFMENPPEDDDKVKEPKPETPEPKPEPIRIPEPEPIRPPNRAYLIDVSKVVERLAWSQAEEKLNAYMRGLDPNNAQPPQAPEPKRGFFGRLAHGVKEAVTHPWETAKKVGRQLRSSMFIRPSEKLYLDKFYRESVNEIQKNKNLMTEIEAALLSRSEGKPITRDKEIRHFEVLNNIIETFAAEVAEENEKGEYINDAEVNAELADLIFDHASGAHLMSRQLFDATVEERILPIIKRKGYKFTNANDEEAKGLLFAHNFYQLAESYKKYVEDATKEMEKKYGPENREIILGHLKGIMNLEIQLGLKERDIRETKPRFVSSWFTKLVDKAQSVPVLGKVLSSPITFAAAGAAATATAITKGAASMSMRALLAAPVVGSIMGGVMGALRRGRDVEYDRGMEMRRSALGQEAVGDRAKEMRKFDYLKLHTEEVVAFLDNLSRQPAGQVNSEERAYVARIFAALAVESEKQVDLFSAAREEGKNLNTRIASINQIKILLKRIEQQHGINPDVLHAETQKAIDDISTQIENTDARFKNWRRLEMVKAGAMGAVVGFAAGAVAECAVTTMRDSFDHSWIGKMTEYFKTDGAGYPPNFAPGVLLSNNTEMALDSSLKIGLDKATGTYILADVKGNVILDHIKPDPQGGLPQQTLDALRDKGFKIFESNHLHSEVTGEHVASPAMAPDTVQVPGLNTKFTLPHGWHVAPKSPTNGFEMLITDENNKTVGNFQLNPDGATINPNSIQLMDKAGWDVGMTSHTITVKGHDAVIAELQKLGGQMNNAPRIWHNNMDPWSGKLTSHDTMGPGHHYDMDLSPRTTGEALKLGERLHDSVMKGELRPDQVPDRIEPLHHVYRHEHISDNSGHIHCEYENRDVGTVLKTSGHIHDGKELRGMLNDSGKDWTFSFKKGINDMLRDGKVNYDGTIDTMYNVMKADLAKGDFSNFHIRFYDPTTGDFNAGNGFDVPMTNGELAIDKAGTLGQTLMNKDGSARWTWEIVYNSSSDGKAHVLATMVGKGGEVPNATKEITDYVFRPREIGVDEISIAPPENNPWFIPLPMNDRKPLEPGQYPDKKKDDKKSGDKPPKSPKGETPPPGAGDKMKKEEDGQKKPTGSNPEGSPGNPPPPPDKSGAAVEIPSHNPPNTGGAAAEAPNAPPPPPELAAAMALELLPADKKMIKKEMQQAIAEAHPNLPPAGQEKMAEKLSAIIENRISQDKWDKTFMLDFVAEIVEWINSEKKLPTPGAEQDAMSAAIIFRLFPKFKAKEINELVDEKRNFVKDLITALTVEETQAEKKKATTAKTATKATTKPVAKPDAKTDTKPASQQKAKTAAPAPTPAPAPKKVVRAGGGK